MNNRIVVYEDGMVRPNTFQRKSLPGTENPRRHHKRAGSEFKEYPISLEKVYPFTRKANTFFDRHTSSGRLEHPHVCFWTLNEMVLLLSLEIRTKVDFHVVKVAEG
jgi:hypothetical protein